MKRLERQATRRSKARKRIFIVDDHPITRYGLVQLINLEPDLQVCGEAGSANQALEALPSAAPDLVLVDLTMPGKNGLEFIKVLQARHPGPVVLVMSMRDESLYAERVLRAGGRGYIMKTEGGGKLLEAIRQVLQGKIYVSAAISESILESLAHPEPATGNIRPGALSDRELEVFQLTGEGCSTREISHRLSISVKTIATHRAHIRDKLHLHKSSELMKSAVRWAATQQLV